MAHLPEVTLYIKYPPDYPSRSPPIFHISSRWLDPKLLQQVNERLLQSFTPDFPVVYEWIVFLQDELVNLYSQEQHQNTLKPSQDQGKTDGVDSDRAKADSSTTQHPCQIFLRSSSQLNDIEEFDRYQKHKEFQQSEHECGICCLTLLGSAVCQPCETCGLTYCRDCLNGYCQV